MKKIILVVGLLIPLPGFTQTYSIKGYEVAGGGGSSSNGQFIVDGTIGQHDAGGPMIGGNYSLSGGFWTFLNVVQTPGSPLLGIRSATNETAILYWAASASSFVLQQNGNLSTTNWISLTNVPVVIDGQFQITVTPNTSKQFYRLINP